MEFRCEAEHVGKDGTKFFINGNQVQLSKVLCFILRGLIHGSPVAFKLDY